MPLSSNSRGSLFMVVSMAGFTVNDSLTKLAIREMDAGQVMFVRGIFAVLLMGGIAWHQGAFGSIRQIRHPAVVLRMVSEVCATTAFLVALAHLPLANTTAIMQALPLAVTLGAVIFLGERIGWRRLLAIAAGFIGVVFIVRPGFEGFNSYALFALLAVLCCTARDLATKRIPSDVSSLLISFVTSVSVMIVGGLLILPTGGWSPMRIEMVAILAVAAVLVLVGYTFIIMAMRTAELAAIAPFRYTALVWSIMLGFLLFGDLPDVPMIIGSAIIVASGIYTLLRERKVSRIKPATTTTGPGMTADGI